MIGGDCNVCINGKLPSYSATCVECGLSRKNYKPMTRADRLRTMTDEELAAWLTNFSSSNVKPYATARGEMYRGRLLDWLREEDE